MKSTLQLLAFFHVLSQIMPLCRAACHPDDLKKGLEEITKLHRQSIDLLMKALALSSHNTITSLDLEEVLHTHGDYDTQKENYVSAVKRVYEISWKLDRNIVKDGRWSKFSKMAVLIRNKTNVLNQSCFRANNITVDTSGGEDQLIEKLLKAVLEMFVAETFLNEHFNHLIEPFSKI